jgi:hypothetical protein
MATDNEDVPTYVELLDEKTVRMRADLVHDLRIANEGLANEAADEIEKLERALRALIEQGRR